MKFFLCLAYTQVLQKKEKERGEGGGVERELIHRFYALATICCFW